MGQGEVNEFTHKDEKKHGCVWAILGGLFVLFGIDGLRKKPSGIDGPKRNKPTQLVWPPFLVFKASF